MSIRSSWMRNPEHPERDAAPRLQTSTVRSMRTSRRTAWQAHRHTPEIEEQLGPMLMHGTPVTINFTPHLVPMNRGILVTAYAKLVKDVSYEDIKAVYDKYYGKMSASCVCLKRASARRHAG